MVIADASPDVGMELPPAAAILMQSLRSVGYTPAAALADLVDNSIAAEARTVHIDVATTLPAWVSVLDDGVGMDPDALISAMRFGSRDPRDRRHDTDLGRFGLGLKTASLSQCRRVSVASLRDARLSVAQWDLDDCDRKGSWWLNRPGQEELPREPMAKLVVQKSGTVVIWEKLDRLEKGGIEEAMLDAADNLALAFHRFLAGEFGQALRIFLNERALETVDPFLAGHARGQTLHDEAISIDGHPVTVSPFVLPFPSRLNPADLQKAGGRERLKTAHGFYIYRGGRLIVPGGWFRIVPADDLIRLARIRVEMPVALDHLWKVDIRKGMAEPPAALRPHLKRIVGAVAVRSRKVYTHRGTPTNSLERIPLWKRHELRDSAATWRINREHPAIRAGLEAVSATSGLEKLLRLIEDNLPIHDIHVHTSNDQAVAEPETPTEAELEALAMELIRSLSGLPDVTARMIEKLSVTEPFNRNPEAAARLSERLRA